MECMGIGMTAFLRRELASARESRTTGREERRKREEEHRSTRRKRL
jgi:hypothetical protein